MGRRRAQGMDDPYLAALSGMGIAAGRPAQVAARFPSPSRIRTGIKMHLITENHPEGAYYPVIYQSDLESPLEGMPRYKVFRQTQWVGGMGQRIMSDTSKFMTSAAYTLRMNEILPQPCAVEVITGTIGGKTVGEYVGVPKKMIEWQGSGTSPTARRVYLATYDVTGTPTTRIYMLKSLAPHMGWYLWKTFTGWQYTDFVLVNNELHLLGTQQGYPPPHVNSYYWKATVNTEQESDWQQGDACREHEITTPDGTMASYQSTFYYPNGSIQVGSNDLYNYINAIVLFNGLPVIIKPDGVYIYRKAGNVVELKVNLRSYFDPDTGKQVCQWGQYLYFNCGQLLCAFDGEKMVIMPPICDWADPSWLPTVKGLANCGEALGVAYDGRAAMFDGQDWHNLYRIPAVEQIFWTTAYRLATDRGYPMVILTTYPSAGYGRTYILEFYPSFFRPCYAETRTARPNWLVSSAFDTGGDEQYLFREFRVKARNLSPTFGIRAWARTEFSPDPTLGFVALPGYPDPNTVQYGDGEERWYTFTVPPSVATGRQWQYKVEFVPAVNGGLCMTLPAITDVQVTVHERPSSMLKRWDFQVLCMDDYEFPDGTMSEKTGAELAMILEEAYYQVTPVKMGLWQPGTPGRPGCWVYRDVKCRPVKHVAYVDESEATGFIYQFHAEEV